MWTGLFILGAFLGYTYAGYAVYVRLRAAWFPKPVRKAPWEGPGASVLIAAHNEAAALPMKIAALIEAARSEPIAEILIGLDGCTDGTEAAVQPFANTPDSIPVRIFSFTEQRGKTAVLNELIPHAATPICLMMDARQTIEPGAISHLLENFADPQVGVVSGSLEFKRTEDGMAGEVSAYWEHEKHIRRAESLIWAVPGATGALYAIRRDLLKPIPPATILDDVLYPMQAVQQGFRCLFEPSARVWDAPETDLAAEQCRKRRTLAGNWQLLHVAPSLFIPLKNPIWHPFYAHKILRLLSPFLLAAFILLLAELSQRGSGIARAGLVVGLTLLIIGVAASADNRFFPRLMNSRLFRANKAFWAMNWTLLLAAYDAAAGRFNPKWR